MAKFCAVCGEEFNDKSGLSWHMKYFHTKKKVLIVKRKSLKQMGKKTCKVCGVDFNNKSNLNRHMKRFHMKEKALISRSESKNRIKVHRRSGNVKLDVLNEVLWQLLLQLLDHKSECVVGRVMGNVGAAASVVGGS